MVDPQKFCNRVNQLFESNQESGRDELVFKDGKVIDCYTAPVVGTDGTNYGRVWFFRDITESKQASHELGSAVLKAKRMLDDADRSRRALLSVVEDQKLAEERLRESEERFRSLYDSMNEGMALQRLVYDASGTATDFVIESVNPAYERFFGQRAVDVVGRKASEVKGTPLVSHLDVFADVVKTGDPVHFETSDDATGKILRVSVSKPGPERFATVFDDITEIQRMSAQIQQSQRIESVGRLAGGIAHDFNNMLSIILGNTELALEKLKPSSPLYADLAEIRMAAQRAAELTRQLLAFARRQTVAPKVINLNETLAGMISMLRRMLGEDIDVSWCPQTELWPVKIDPSQVDQILANLCVNARDAISGTGRLTIETQNLTLDTLHGMSDTDADPGDYVMLVVSDTGCGMSKEVIKHVFEPFYTTKQLGEGSGLGLATIYGIVKQNRGFIHVYSEPGRGATFKIALPRYTGAAETDTRAQTDENRTLYGEETILLVEDDPAILAMTKGMLKKLGYRVHDANSPQEALCVARQMNGAFDVLLSDIVMPEMNGIKMAKLLTSEYPKVKSLFMSGYTAAAIVRQGVLEDSVHFIQKPFTIQALSQKIRKALDNG